MVRGATLLACHLLLRTCLEQGIVFVPMARGTCAEGGEGVRVATRCHSASGKGAPGRGPRTATATAFCLQAA
jgi:hypothetical protein